jgi:endonuclease/exonuclease/phosphatase (EEP) superfamily protein YafD
MSDLRFSRLKPMILAINILAVAVGLATFLGFLGNLWWGFELLDHLRLQYVWMLLLVLLVNAFVRMPWVWGLGIPLGLNLALILPLFWNPIQIENLPTEGTLKILHVNLDRHNSQFDRAINYIQSQEADVVFLQEVTPTWFKRIESDLPKYRVVLSRPQTNSQGVAMLVPITPSSAIKFQEPPEIIHLPEWSERPLITATIRWKGQDIKLLSLHTTRPRNTGTSKFQQQEFDEVARWSRQQQDGEHSVVILGDFNNTPGSGRSRKFLRDGNLIDSQRGFGLQPTWMASLPFPLQISIDRCVYSPKIATLNRKIGTSIGSDHLPLWVELTVVRTAIIEKVRFVPQHTLL